jgi:hypothetical protein
VHYCLSYSPFPQVIYFTELLATTVWATEVLYTNGQKTEEKVAFHDYVNVPRKLKSSADYAAVLSHTLQLPLPPGVLPYPWTAFRHKYTASSSAMLHCSIHTNTVTAELCML